MRALFFFFFSIAYRNEIEIADSRETSLKLASLLWELNILQNVIAENKEENSSTLYRVGSIQTYNLVLGKVEKSSTQSIFCLHIDVQGLFLT